MASKEETDKLSFILYEKNNSPRYFEIKKAVVRFFVFGLPFLSIISLVLLAVGVIYFKEHRTNTFQKTLEIPIEGRQENSDLKQQNEELKAANQDLTQKLTSGTLTPLQSLSLFAPVFRHDFPIIELVLFQIKGFDAGVVDGAGFVNLPEGRHGIVLNH